MNIFDELPYDEIESHIDEVYGYSETSDYEFMSDDELEQLERTVFGGDIKNEETRTHKNIIPKKRNNNIQKFHFRR